MFSDYKNFKTAVANNFEPSEECLAAAKVECKEYGIDEIEFEKYLYTKNIQHPDLLIRTSGEQRLSNFLLWQSAYTELAFTKTLWPDFSKESLINIIDEYQKRDRRYGGTS